MKQNYITTTRRRIVLFARKRRHVGRTFEKYRKVVVYARIVTVYGTRRNTRSYCRRTGVGGKAEKSAWPGKVIKYSGRYRLYRDGFCADLSSVHILRRNIIRRLKNSFQKTLLLEILKYSSLTLTALIKLMPSMFTHICYYCLYRIDNCNYYLIILRF